MTWLVMIVVALYLFGRATKINRAMKDAVTSNKVIDVTNKKQITFEELAKKRHNVHTAHNIIRLGLVQPARHPREYAIQNAYSGVFDENNHYYDDVVVFYGLSPFGANFVGH